MDGETLCVRGILMGHEEHDAYERRAATQTAAIKVFEQMQAGKNYCVRWEEETRPVQRALSYGAYSGNLLGNEQELLVRVSLTDVAEFPAWRDAAPEYDKMTAYALVGTALGEVKSRIVCKVYAAKWRVKTAWRSTVAKVREVLHIKAKP